MAELTYTPQGAEMVSGMIYAPDEQGVIMHSALIYSCSAMCAVLLPTDDTSDMLAINH